MPDFHSNNRFESKKCRLNSVEESFALNNDLIMEQILNNLNTTSIGQVLKRIALLPEVRKEKVLDVRRQLTEGKYDLNERLEIALDKVLEHLTT